MAAGRAKEILFNSRNDAREDGGFAIRKEGPPSFYAWGGASRITLEPQTLGFAAPSWFLSFALREPAVVQQPGATRSTNSVA